MLASIHKSVLLAWYPGTLGDVNIFLQSCPVCQKMAKHDSVHPVPIQCLYFAFQSFECGATDIVGPLSTKQGYCYISNCVDLCRHWVEAIPLKYLTHKEVADAFTPIFCRVGFPDVLLMDNNSQFVS